MLELVRARSTPFAKHVVSIKIRAGEITCQARGDSPRCTHSVSSIMARSYIPADVTSPLLRLSLEPPPPTTHFSTSLTIVYSAIQASHSLIYLSQFGPT